VSLLIDGYNLLFASGIFPESSGPPTLERSRTALLDFVAAALTPAERKRATIVFDAAAAPPGLPRDMMHNGMHVHFAPRKGSADDVLEEMIEAEADPRNLTVVSSDHRIQRAARRRRAKYVDSLEWLANIRQAQSSDATRRANESDHPAPLMENPFPPGYGEDLLDDLP
jgi:predicted RNA-binding protein with PIN domain